MKLKFKKLHADVQLPKYAKEGDACLDLIATSLTEFKLDDYFEYGTGLCVEIPEGYVGLLFPRSSISIKNLYLCNHVGVIDSGYRGEIKLRFKHDTFNSLFLTPTIYKIGDKIGQLMVIPIPQLEPEFIEELSETKRGEEGFGSSGN